MSTFWWKHEIRYNYTVWGLEHFHVRINMTVATLLRKILFYSLLSSTVDFKKAFFFASATSLASCLAANLRAQGTAGLPVEEPTTVFSNQRRADAVSSACPQQCPPWHTNLSQPFSLKPIKFHGFIKKWKKSLDAFFPVYIVGQHHPLFLVSCCNSSFDGLSLRSPPKILSTRWNKTWRRGIFVT